MTARRGINRESFENEASLGGRSSDTEFELYSYDAFNRHCRGSYQSGTVESFTYNLQNRLTGYQNSETTASHEYGANGLRKSKTVDGTKTGDVWDRGNLAAELTGNSTKNVYNYGVDGIVTRT